MPFFQKDRDVCIHYREEGSGFPLFIIYGGGLNSAVTYPAQPFDAFEEFRSEYRCISMDLRYSPLGQSSGPLDPEGAWDAITGDQLALLDHLGVDRFFIMGFCIGNPLIWNLQKHAPGRIVAAVSAQPSGIDPKDPMFLARNNLTKWAPEFMATRPGISREAVEHFLERMYRGKDFVLTVSRDLVRSCPTPLLVLPEDVPAHPLAVALEMARLAPRGQQSLYPWKDSPEHIRLAVRHIRTFLKANRVE